MEANLRSSLINFNHRSVSVGKNVYYGLVSLFDRVVPDQAQLLLDPHDLHLDHLFLILHYIVELLKLRRAQLDLVELLLMESLINKRRKYVELKLLLFALLKLIHQRGAIALGAVLKALQVGPKLLVLLSGKQAGLLQCPDLCG